MQQSNQQQVVQVKQIRPLFSNPPSNLKDLKEQAGGLGSGNNANANANAIAKFDQIQNYLQKFNNNRSQFKDTQSICTQF
ncbi:Hsr recombination cassette protein [Helicobacter mustelae]|uniref:Hsr recombination cassette protein n=1 Tax=Helicobacter mustelae TaxID=217 RepID=UPI000DA28459|nr:Hsr recombination cassette protein [Helicobacter mustelae]SQH71626.1 Hsr recombination casette protein [Helicobacter mustelae]